MYSDFSKKLVVVRVRKRGMLNFGRKNSQKKGELYEEYKVKGKRLKSEGWKR